MLFWVIKGCLGVWLLSDNNRKTSHLEKARTYGGKNTRLVGSQSNSIAFLVASRQIPPSLWTFVSPSIQWRRLTKWSLMLPSSPNLCYFEGGLGRPEWEEEMATNSLGVPLPHIAQIGLSKILPNGQWSEQGRVDRMGEKARILCVSYWIGGILEWCASSLWSTLVFCFVLF